MDVTHQFQQVEIFLAQNGFKAILEQVPGSIVSSVEPHSIAGQKTTHDRRDRYGPGSQEQVEVLCAFANAPGEYCQSHEEYQ